jgi:hypothetical protein
MVQDAVKAQGSIGLVEPGPLKLAIDKLGFFKRRSITRSMESANRSLEKLAKFSVNDLRPGAPKYKEACQALKAAVKGQYGLDSALTELGRKCNDSQTALLCETMATACQRRVAEMLNVAGRMVTSPVTEGETVGRAMQNQMADMHGHQKALTDLSKEANDLFTEVNELSHQRDALTDEQTLERSTALTTRIETLRGKLADVFKPGQAASDGKPVLVFDQSLREAFDHALEAARSRVESLAQTPELGKLFATALKDLCAVAPGLSEWAKACGDPYPGEIGKLASKIEAFQTLLQGKFTAPGLGNIGLNDPTSDVRQKYDELKQLADDLIQQMSLDYNSHRGDTKTQEKLGRLLSALDTSIAGRKGGNIFMASLQELAGMRVALNQPTASFHTGEYLAQAMEHTLSVPTLVECSLRQIDPRYMDLVASPEAQVSRKVLGNGAANTVTLCSFRDSRGEVHEKVFKPEYPASFGLLGLRIHGLGYTDSQRVLGLNLASADVAKAIGAEEVVAKSSAGTLDGQFGLFMSRAPGQTAFALLRPGKDLEAPPIQQILARMVPDKKALAQANLQRELCRLEWADLLSGQVDRHGDNYLVNIDKESGAVQVTGIDNDASFGQALVGPGRIDLSKLADRRRIDEIVNTYRLPTHSGILDLHSPDASLQEGMAKVTEALGLNQVTKPILIDQTTFDKLTRINEADYEDTLRQNLKDDGAVAAAMWRLAEAKQLAVQLMCEGRVIADWSGDNDKVERAFTECSTDFLRDHAEPSRWDRAMLPFYLREGWNEAFH